MTNEVVYTKKIFTYFSSFQIFQSLIAWGLEYGCPEWNDLIKLRSGGGRLFWTRE